MEPPRAVLFDAYGTLFDVYSVVLRAEQLFPGQGQRLAQLWRDKQIEYSRLVSCDGEGSHYRPFWELTRAGLRYALETIASERDPKPSSADLEHWSGVLMNEYRHLSAFPEVRPTLQALRDRGVVAGVLSNGDPDMLAVAVRSAGLDGLLDPVVSVHAARRYKTHPAAYALGEQATGLPARQIAFVSSNGWDALGASWHGYRTLWVNRAGLPFETLDDTRPERTGTTLAAVLDFFDPEQEYRHP